MNISKNIYSNLTSVRESVGEPELGAGNFLEGVRASKKNYNELEPEPVNLFRGSKSRNR